MLAAVLIFQAAERAEAAAPRAPNASPIATGLLLTASPRPNVDVQVLDLASGRGMDLPRSERARLRDLPERGWYVSRSTRELLREDGSEGVDIFSWPDLALKASFKLDSEHAASGRGQLLRLSLLDLSWSADGRWLSFLAELGHDRWGSGLGGGGCPSAYAVPADAPSPVAMDGFADKVRMLHQPDGRGGRVPLRSCAMLRWF